MTAPSVFISYSHKDEDWKDRLVTHLRVLEMEDMLNVWDDRRIEAGDDWKPEIVDALNAANIAILLISANFLTSKFIRDEEVSRLLDRRTKEGIRVIPLIVKPCAWTQVRWLSPIQGQPKDGRPLSSGNENQIDTDLAALATEIAGIIRRLEKETSEAPKSGETSDVWKIPPEKISLAKLPSTSSDLFGRDDRLKQLDDAWNNQDINILSLVAWGGVGKTALVNKWLSNLAKDNYRGAERVYGWSFYSQGAAEGRQVSADQFIAAALTWFGDPDPTAGSPWDKGERLADYIKQKRTLLVLDGLEPLQSPPPVETGKIKDPGLASLLRELARQNPGLVVISTRLPVDDLKDFNGSTAKEIDLEALSDDAGAEYLKHLGVDGTEEERKEASHDFGGHALALTLLGRYLKVVHNGDIRKRKEIPHVMDEQKQGKHAHRVMESYEVFLKGKPELDILRLMGLFDRPAEKGALDALRKKMPTKEKGIKGLLKDWKNTDVINGLTDNIHKLSEKDWKIAVNNLRELRLLAEQDPHEPDTLDCHPLLREHFGEKLKTENVQAWREAHGRLYEFYKSTTKELPDTLEEMAPLFAAVMHGCQAGKHQEAMDEVYWKRIARGNKSFTITKLGALGADLATISGFFDGTSWQKPIDGLVEADKRFVLGGAGFRLRGLGRLVESVQPTLASLDACIAQKDSENSGRTANNLSATYLTIGDMKHAITYAEQAIQLGGSSDDWQLQIIGRASLANALHQVGQFGSAQTIFHEAEEIQKKNQSEFPLLTSLQGYTYCDLLLSQDNYADVHQRVAKFFDWRQSEDSLLDIALENLSLGRAHFQQSNYEHDHPVAESIVYINHAVKGLRQAGIQEFLTRGLLARAEYYRATSDFTKAQKDLDEAFVISTRGGMGLHLADCHLEYARLYLAKGETTKAREHWQIANDSIEKMGYHRRDKEVQELEEQLK